MFRSLSCKSDAQLSLIRDSRSICCVVHLEAKYRALWKLLRETFRPCCRRCTWDIRCKEACALVQVFHREYTRLTDKDQDVVNNLFRARHNLNGLHPLVFGNLYLGIHDFVRNHARRWHKERLRHVHNHVWLTECPAILDGRKSFGGFGDVSKGTRSAQPRQHGFLLRWLKRAIVYPGGLRCPDCRCRLPRRHGALLDSLLNHPGVGLDVGDCIQLERSNSTFAVAADTVLLDDWGNGFVVGNRVYWSRCDRFQSTPTWLNIRSRRLLARNDCTECV